MKSRLWPVLAVAVGCLLALLLVSGLATRRKAAEIYGEMAELNSRYRHTEQLLKELRADMHRSGIFVRDYLLDPSHLRAESYRTELRNLQASMARNLDEVAASVDRDQKQKFDTLHKELEGYWASFDQIFDWTPQQKAALSYFVLRRDVMPRRDAFLAIAHEIEELNDANMVRQNQALAAREREFYSYIDGMLLAALLMGLSIALVGVIRVQRLERLGENQRLRTEHAEEEMRSLSRQLVQAQEQERKRLSRELHDEIGQMLTGLRMELGQAERLRNAGDDNYRQHISETKRLAETIMKSVRDLAMGLRPSMLDDFGLGPALEWQAREYSRRYGVPVNVAISGELSDISERQRTCIYRLAQEALTNCARHSRAQSINVRISGDDRRVELTVADDGIGMNASSASAGIGLVGMKERVRELGGQLHIETTLGRGTTLRVLLPAERTSTSEQVAHSAV